LWPASLRDIQLREQLDSRDDRVMILFGAVQRGRQHAIEAEPGL
jgi:hypothetical protein